MMRQFPMLSYIQNLKGGNLAVQQLVNSLAPLSSQTHSTLFTSWRHISSTPFKFSEGMDSSGNSSPSYSEKNSETENAVSSNQLSPQPSTSNKLLESAKLWRQWVDGKIDEKHRAAPTSTTASSQQQKYRPKDPAKDWKNASRSVRSTQNRIASILAPEGGSSEVETEHNKGKYGILGTASDAPRLVPGAAARAEELSPDRLLPHRLFYPGGTYTPDELDPYKAKSIGLLSDLTVRRGVISKAMVAGNADFRNPSFLNNFISDAGKLQPRRRTKLTAKWQRELARQVKTARCLALMNPTAKIVGPKQHRGGQNRGSSSPSSQPQTR